MSVRTARAPSKIYSQYAATLTPQPIKLRGHSIGVKAVLITSNRETVQFSLGQMVCQCTVRQYVFAEKRERVGDWMGLTQSRNATGLGCP